MAKILHTDGTIAEVEPANGADFKLEEAQALVEGYVEVFDIGWLKRQGQHGCDGVIVPNGPRVSVADDDIFLCNEEGLLEGLRPNPIASALAGRPIVGPVVLCSGRQFL